MSNKDRDSVDTYINQLELSFKELQNSTVELKETYEKRIEQQSAEIAKLVTSLSEKTELIAWSDKRIERLEAKLAMAADYTNRLCSVDKNGKYLCKEATRVMATAILDMIKQK